MAKKSPRSRNIIKYMLYTIVVLLITLSLLSLFIFKFANFASDSVVLGASVGPKSSVVTCESCAKSLRGSVGIILEQNGADSKNWGAQCVTKDMLNSIKHLAFIYCPASIGGIH